MANGPPVSRFGAFRHSRYGIYCLKVCNASGAVLGLDPANLNLQNLAIEDVGDDILEILEYDGAYWGLHGTIKIDSKTKGKLKKIVEHLIDKDFNTLIVK